MVTAMDAITLRGNGDKGSLGNRVNCATEQVKNDATSYLKAAGVIGTVTGTLRLMQKLQISL